MYCPIKFPSGPNPRVPENTKIPIMPELARKISFLVRLVKFSQIKRVSRPTIKMAPRPLNDLVAKIRLIDIAKNVNLMSRR